MLLFLQSLKQWRVFLFSSFLNVHLNMLCIFVLLVRQNPIQKQFRVLSFFLLWLVSRSDYFFYFRYSFNHFNLFILFIGCGGSLYSFTGNCITLMTYFIAVVFVFFLFRLWDLHIFMLWVHLFHFTMQQCVLWIGLIANNSHFVALFFRCICSWKCFGYNFREPNRTERNDIFFFILNEKKCVGFASICTENKSAIYWEAFIQAYLRWHKNYND